MKMECIICRGQCKKLKRTITAKTGKTFEVYKCPGCSMMFVDPLPAIPEIVSEGVFGEEYYQTFYRDGRNYFSDETLELERKVVDEQDRVVKKLVSGRKYLDIGCGDGKLLFLMKEKGWDGAGVEISEISAKYGMDRYKVDIRVGQLNENEFEKESFDFITLRHVVEHLNDPVSVIRKANRLLKKGGIIKIDTDNSESLFNKFIFLGLMARNNKDSIGKLYPPAHLLYFCRKSITCLLKNSGFEIMELFCPPQGSPKHFPRPNKYGGNIKEKIKQLIDDTGGLIGKGEVLVVYAKKLLNV